MPNYNLVVNCLTGESQYIQLSEEENNLVEQSRIRSKESENNLLEENNRKKTNAALAAEKLRNIGLTQDEIDALVGV